MLADVDETARLILMTDPAVTPLTLSREMKKIHPDSTADDLHEAWGRYRGWDGRTLPTHDIETGRPLRQYQSKPTGL